MTGLMKMMSNGSVKNFDSSASCPRFHTRLTRRHTLGNMQIAATLVSQSITNKKPNKARQRTGHSLRSRLAAELER